jgi:DNA modification methylase
MLKGDMRDVLPLLETASVDSVVCDPPYGLSKEPDIFEVMRHWIAGDDYVHRGGGFMGKSWDSFVPGPSCWRECYRVLKPGGYLIAFGGARTYDLLVVAIRMAGFEVRDQLQWLYGQGFPKSLDVSKAIDKAAGAKREVVGVDQSRAARLVNQTGDYVTEAGWSAGNRSADITAPATSDAEQWSGWGTALKPAHEPIVLARKPLDRKTVAANVLAHGTGALNVDGCRVGEFVNTTPSGADRYNAALAEHGYRPSAYPQGEHKPDGRPGRWPANVVLDEEAAVILDQQTGTLQPSKGAYVRKHGKGQFLGALPGGGTDSPNGMIDSGGASRFFYCAKTSTSERNLGLPEGMKNKHSTVKPIALMRWLTRLVTPPGGLCLDPFGGSGSTGCAAVLEGFDFLGVELAEEDQTVIDVANYRISYWDSQRA